MTFRPLRRPRQKSSAAFQEVFSRTALQTSRNAGSSVLTQREAISKEILSTACKHTALIFIPPVSELSAHKLYFHHPARPEIPALRTPQRDSLMNIARKLSAIKFRPTHDFLRKERLKLTSMWQHGIRSPYSHFLENHATVDIFD